MPENHRRVFRASRFALKYVSNVNILARSWLLLLLSVMVVVFIAEIRGALHVCPSERANERAIRRFRADKAVNYSPLRALSSATNAQACAPTRAGNTNS